MSAPAEVPHPCTMGVKGGNLMATAIDIRELPARLDEALALASAGGEVILLDGPTPGLGSYLWLRPPRGSPGCTPGHCSPPRTLMPRSPTISGPGSHEAGVGHARLHLVGQ